MDDLTVAEAAALLRRNRELVRTWVASGRLAGRKRADRWFIRSRDLARFKKSEPVRRTWSRSARRRAARRWAASGNAR